MLRGVAHTRPKSRNLCLSGIWLADARMVGPRPAPHSTAFILMTLITTFTVPSRFGLCRRGADARRIGRNIPVRLPYGEIFFKNPISHRPTPKILSLGILDYHIPPPSHTIFLSALPIDILPCQK